MKKSLWIFGAAAAVLLAAAAVFVFWCKGAFLPDWIVWRQVRICDKEETLLLHNRTVTLTGRDGLLWQSDDGVLVQDLLLCDIDHDKEDELLLLCWRRGRYGDYRPFWVRRNDMGWSQHIFIYDKTQSGFHPIWMASDIRGDAASWYFSRASRLVITSPDGTQAAWDWRSWGLEKIPLQKAPTVSVGAVGDNLIHYPIYDYAMRHFDGSFDHLFSHVLPELSQYDLTCINQETIYVDTPEQYSDYPLFGTPVQVGQAIIDAGFDIVSAATNHAFDKGKDAIDLTVSLYEKAGVVCAGLQASADTTYRPYELLEKNGIQCAVLSYTQMSNLPLDKNTPHMVHTLDDEARVRQDLLAAKDAADLVLVFVHWGTEYETSPDESQLRWAQIFADCGVHVVIGTHPHVLQDVCWVTGELGNRTLVYYSLGNFISAQTDPACTVGGLACFTAVREENGCTIIADGLKTLQTTNRNGLYTTRLQSP